MTAARLRFGNLHGLRRVELGSFLHVWCAVHVCWPGLWAAGAAAVSRLDVGVDEPDVWFPVGPTVSCLVDVDGCEAFGEDVVA